MHSSSQLNGINAAHLHKAVLDAYHLTAEKYTRNQSELSNSLENLPAKSRLITLALLNTEPLNTEHSKRLLIPTLNRNCLTHLVKQSACKELNSKRRTLFKRHLNSV